MPLIDTGYTLKEACELISQKLPDEDSSANLIEVLHAGEAKAEMTCDTTGNTYRLPSEVWKSTDGRFDFDIDSSQGRIQEKLVRHPTPSYTAQPRGHFDRDGHFHPNYVTGEVRIERTSFDALLDKVGGDALLKPRRRGRRARSLEAESVGRREPTPLRVTPKERPELGEGNEAVASPQGVPGVASQSSQKRRRGGAKPGPYYPKLKKFMETLYEKDLEKFENGTPTELRNLVEWRFKNDGVRAYPNRSGLDKAIAKAKREIIDSDDRI